MAAENASKHESEIPASLSALYMDSFAYLTIKDRMPVILSKVADSVHRKKNSLDADSGESAAEDLKTIVGEISKLRYEIQTNKTVTLLQDDRDDVNTWNGVLENLTKKNNEAPKWFTSAWLYLECYMYRRIEQSIRLSKVMQNYDVFEDQKKNAYHTSVMAVQTLLTNLLTDINSLPQDTNKLSALFTQYLQVALWGNKCDLSISASMENSQTTCILDQLHSLEPNILLDDTQTIWNLLQNLGGKGRIDIILDNAGFELITDLCLAEFLLSAKLATSIHFHGKAMPWFVSDVTAEDFSWTLEMLAATNNLALSQFGSKWQDRIKNGSWTLHFNDFWTTPFDFAEMKSNAADLYSKLSKADFLIFKGDLNYRKLVGDLRWDNTTTFERSLRGFHPAPLVTLRALKSDVVVGLGKGEGDKMPEKDESWMINGNWSVISYCDKRKA